MEGVKSVEENFKEFASVLTKFGVAVERLTGRDSKEDTERIIQAFKNGDVQVLIATTVIEVGVNVPTATTMVITDADRFGLSTLHQLHGRVGRGDVQAYCVLESSGKAFNRLQVMCDTTDGFKIAEADLKTRGAGDLIGTQQVGANRYVQLMLTHSDVYQRAQKEARFILKNNLSCPMLERIVRSDEQTVS